LQKSVGVLQVALQYFSNFFYNGLKNTVITSKVVFSKLV